MCILLFFLFVFIGLALGIKFTFKYHKPKYISTGYGWLDVDDHPIPDGYTDEFLGTDGNEVKSFVLATYNKKGRPMYSIYTQKEMIAWMPFPEAPKE